jgi:phage baseplate assembly protein W
MANGLSAALPLIVDETDGPYRLNKTINELARQNLKMIILTNPGERVMDPLFGVGLQQYLFENQSNTLTSSILGRISAQVGKYLPYISLENVSATVVGSSQTQLWVQVEYSVSGDPLLQTLGMTLNIDF